MVFFHVWTHLRKLKVTAGQRWSSLCAQKQWDSPIECLSQTSFCEDELITRSSFSTADVKFMNSQRPVNTVYTHTHIYL